MAKKQTQPALISKKDALAKFGNISEQDRFRFFYDKVSPWINRGHVYGFEMHEEMNRPTIVENESAIYALTSVPTGSVLGITGGRRGHLFYYHPSFYVVDLGLLSEKTVDGGAIARTTGDVVVGGWHGVEGGMFRHDAARELGTGQEDFYARKDKIEFLPLPAKGEGVLAVVYSAAEKKCYAVTTARRVVSLADGKKKVAVEAKLEHDLAPALVVLPDGSLLGGTQEGRLWKLEQGSKKARLLDAYVPCEKGKRYVAGVQSMLLARDGMVYGGGATDGFFFGFDPRTGKVLNFGKPHRQGYIRGLSEGHEGLIYGIVEEPAGLAHLFCFDPAERTFDDLGVINTFIPIQWAPYSLGAICTGKFGEIYLGESDTIGHLFVYHPPVVKR